MNTENHGPRSANTKTVKQILEEFESDLAGLGPKEEVFLITFNPKLTDCLEFWQNHH